MLSAPGRLWLATATLFFAVPLVALEVLIVHRAPWWDLPHRAIAIWSAGVALFLLLAGWRILKGRSWAVALLGLGGVVWLLASSWLAVRFRQPALGFFALLVMLFCATAIGWVRLELSRSFLDPRLSWYQGLPRPIPGLRCRISLDGGPVEFRVGRLDKEGTFIYSDLSPGDPASPILAPLFASGRAGQRSELLFQFRNRQVRCEGTPMATLVSAVGAGFHFAGIAPDMKKELGDFVETLRGEGYV